MTFSFADGTHLDVETSNSRSFIEHDLSWAALARGGLRSISDPSQVKANEQLRGLQPVETLKPEGQKCRSLIQRISAKRSVPAHSYVHHVGNDYGQAATWRQAKCCL